MTQTKRICLVTGGSRGIGAGMVRAFAGAGHEVIFTYNKSEDSALALQKELAHKGKQATPVKVDLQNLPELEQLLAKVGETGIDVLVNNAAVLEYHDFRTTPVELWDQTQAVNVRAPFVLSQRLLPAMMERGWGRVINLTSIGGQWGGTLAVHYAVSKSALIGLTRSLAKLSANRGVTVNAISPGLVATDIIAGEIGTPEFKQKVANIPVGRIAEIEEIVLVARFLASDDASYITGQTINVNGGMYFG